MRELEENSGMCLREPHWLVFVKERERERERERENESLCVRNKESHTGECVGEGENTGEWCERCDVLPQV